MTSKGVVLRYPRYGGQECPENLIMVNDCDNNTFEGFRRMGGPPGPGRPVPGRPGLPPRRHHRPPPPPGCPPCNC